ncbi:hypothetical protein HZH66_007918 [Vespula vulgaris]|uniref:Uncharacterized protein n=1 Tax=Vespula vulgaris TaxID=7454 RepID=A0A834N4K3_VESVU|nr:hypothetical protein HZH66_007918 [Vespula vulgaris]
MEYLIRIYDRNIVKRCVTSKNDKDRKEGIREGEKPSARPNRSVTEKTEISLRNNRYTTPVKDKPPMAAPRPRLRQ